MPKRSQALTRKQEHWRRHLEACGRGGDTIAEYARRHDLNRAQLYTWRIRLKALGLLRTRTSLVEVSQSPIPPPRPSFSAVRLIDSSSPSGGELRIRLTNGVVVEIADPSAWLPDSNLLALLAALR